MRQVCDGSINFQTTVTYRGADGTGVSGEFAQARRTKGSGTPKNSQLASPPFLPLSCTRLCTELK